MYKKRMSIFVVMISTGLSATQAFAEEIVYPFGHPFTDHLYKVEANEGMSLADLPNGKYYDAERSPSLELYDNIYGETDRYGLPPIDNTDLISFNYESETMTIEGGAWNIVWADDPNDPDQQLPEGEDFFDQPLGRYIDGHEKAFFHIDCSDYNDVDNVYINDLHIINDITSNPNIAPTNHPIPYRILSINNCHSVKIENSTFKGPVILNHIEIENTEHIYIDNIEISGTEDPNASGTFYLGGAIAIKGGNQNQHVKRSISSTIIKNSYIHDFTARSQKMKDKNPTYYNYDAAGIRSPGTGIFFNNYIENYFVKHPDYYNTNSDSFGLPDPKVTGLDVGHSRGDSAALNSNSHKYYSKKTFKIERNIFDNVRENKITGKFGESWQNNKLLFSNNIYFNTAWKAYFCFTEVVFAFESYHFTKRDGTPDLNLLKYEGCPKGEYDVDSDGTFDTDNWGGKLMPITRYNTHYYFEESYDPAADRVRPNTLTYLTGDAYENYQHVNAFGNPMEDQYGNIIRTLIEDLIRSDHNIYSFNLSLDPTLKPNNWILGDVSTEWDVKDNTNEDALAVFRRLSGQGHNSELIGSVSICENPMLEAREETPNPFFKYLNSIYCSDLRNSGLSDPLFDDGFGYFHYDYYQLFRRDFYGNSRGLFTGIPISVGAIK